MLFFPIFPHYEKWYRRALITADMVFCYLASCNPKELEALKQIGACSTQVAEIPKWVYVQYNRELFGGEGTIMAHHYIHVLPSGGVFPSAFRP